MTAALMVASKDGSNRWPVYLEDDAPRAEKTQVRTTGPLVGSVAAWSALMDLANERQIPIHGIYGSGLDEMEAELGSMPD
jgi:hypothetical protein